MRRARSDSSTVKTPPPAVTWKGGVHIEGTHVWCDAPRARGLCFLSYATGAGQRTRAGHKQLLVTPTTHALLGSRDDDALVTPTGRPFSLGEARLELFPSGRMPGAAALVIAPRRDGPRIIYAGELNALREGERARLAEPCEVRGADVVVVAAPVAALGGSLPPRDVIEQRLIDAVRRALEEKRTPIVLAQAAGAAEEVVAILGAAGIALRAHPRIAARVTALRALGCDLVSPLGTTPRDGVPLVWPIELRASPALVALRAPLRIAVTALALDPDAGARLAVDELVPLADHADLDALVAWVSATGAREVRLTAGYGERLVRALAPRAVFALGPPRQLDLF